MRRKRVGSALFLAVMLVMLYLPVAVVVLYSFNANTSRFTFAFTGFSTQYYQGLLHDTKGLVSALMTSLELAAYSCGLSLVIGTLGALGLAGAQMRGKGAVETLSLLPVMIPEIILGFALMAVFTFAGVKNDMVKPGNARKMIPSTTITIPPPNNVPRFCICMAASLFVPSCYLPVYSHAPAGGARPLSLRNGAVSNVTKMTFRRCPHAI